MVTLEQTRFITVGAICIAAITSVTVLGATHQLPESTIAQFAIVVGTALSSAILWITKPKDPNDPKDSKEASK